MSDTAATYSPVAISPGLERDFVLHSRIVHVQQQTCSCCQRTETFSKAFDVYQHATIAAARRLVPIAELPAAGKSDVPVGVSYLTPKKIAICHACVNLIEAPGETRQVSQEEWREVLRRDAQRKKQEAIASGRAKPVPRAPSPDDLADIPF